MKNPTHAFARLTVGLILLVALGCSALIAKYDQTAYSNVISVKVDALALIDKSNEPYTTHTTDVANFQLELNKAVEYDKHRPKNDFTNAQWAILIDTNRYLLGGFLKRWRDKGKIEPAQVDNIKKTVGTAFDQIAELESGKIKPDNK